LYIFKNIILFRIIVLLILAAFSGCVTSKIEYVESDKVPVEKFSGDATAYYKRGYARFKLKEYKKAISDFSTVLEKSETSESFFYRGNCYYSLKDYKNALADYTKALEQEPDNYDIYYNRGYANFRLKNYSAAVADWQRAVELNPDYNAELEIKIKNCAG